MTRPKRVSYISDLDSASPVYVHTYEFRGSSYMKEDMLVYHVFEYVYWLCINKQRPPTYNLYNVFEVECVKKVIRELIENGKKDYAYIIEYVMNILFSEYMRGGADTSRIHDDARYFINTEIRKIKEMEVLEAGKVFCDKAVKQAMEDRGIKFTAGVDPYKDTSMKEEVITVQVQKEVRVKLPQDVPFQ